MFRNSTARRVSRTNRPGYVMSIDWEADSVSTRRRKPVGRTTARQAAIRASQLGLA